MAFGHLAAEADVAPPATVLNRRYQAALAELESLRLLAEANGTVTWPTFPEIAGIAGDITRQVQDAAQEVVATVGNIITNFTDNVSESATAAAANALTSLAQKDMEALHLVDLLVDDFVLAAAKAKESLSVGMSAYRNSRSGQALTRVDDLVAYEALVDETLGGIFREWGDMKALFESVGATMSQSMEMAKLPDLALHVRHLFSDSEVHADAFMHSVMAVADSGPGLSHMATPEAVAEKLEQMSTQMDDAMGHMDTFVKTFEQGFLQMEEGLDEAVANTLPEHAARTVQQSLEKMREMAQSILRKTADSAKGLLAAVVDLAPLVAHSRSRAAPATTCSRVMLATIVVAHGAALAMW